ncbi:hypothetical protein BDBG_17196, partial [Blastomyces gilchristii SLH14081]
ESLISEIAASRSSICSFSLTAHSSSAQNTAELSLQNPAVSLSSLYKETSVKSLISIITYLHCTKQLKKERILYTYLFSYSHCFCYICNNDFYLSV